MKNELMKKIEVAYHLEQTLVILREIDTSNTFDVLVESILMTWLKSIGEDING